MTMARRREARKAPGLERWSGKEEDASRNPKRIGGKWMSSAIRNLMDVCVCMWAFQTLCLPLDLVDRPDLSLLRLGSKDGMGLA